MSLTAHPAPRTAWSHRTWVDFASAPRSATRIAVLPLHGMGDHGLGLPLGLEEAVTESLLSTALVGIPSDAICVLPPVRDVLGPYDSCCFGVDPDTALAIIADLAAGVRAAGFRKLVLLNSSPWHAELTTTAALEARAALGLDTYVIGWAGLGLNLHPASEDRSRAQAVGSSLLGCTPDAAFRDADASDADFRPGYWNRPPHVTVDSTLGGLSEATQAAARLRTLLGEIAAHRTPGTDPSLAAWRQSPSPVIVSPAAAKTGASRSFSQLTPRQLAALTSSGEPARAIALLATGAIEQHGPHLPVGVDAFLGEIWTKRLIAELPESTSVWLTPALAYGKSNEHRDFPGTLSLSERSLRHAVLAQARQLHAWGFRRIAVLNTHGGNSAVLTYTLREIQTTLGLRTALLSVPASTDLPAQERVNGFHAGAWETSLMLAAMPDHVRRDQVRCEYPAHIDAPGLLRPEKAPATFAWLSSDLSRSGVMGDATAASAEQGQTWLYSGAASLAQRLIAFSQSEGSL